MFQKRSKYILSVVFFLLAYPLSLWVWLFIKPYYGWLCGEIGAHFAGIVLDWSISKSAVTHDALLLAFNRFVPSAKGVGEMIVDVRIIISTFTFNAPLTFGLMVALAYLFQSRVRFIIEVLLSLLGIHVIYVFTSTGLQLFHASSTGPTGLVQKVAQFFWEFLFAFTDNMLIRFEPFLVAVYLWMRSETANTKKGV